MFPSVPWSGDRSGRDESGGTGSAGTGSGAEGRARSRGASGLLDRALLRARLRTHRIHPVGPPAGDPRPPRDRDGALQVRAARDASAPGPGSVHPSPVRARALLGLPPDRHERAPTSLRGALRPHPIPPGRRFHHPDRRQAHADRSVRHPSRGRPVPPSPVHLRLPRPGAGGQLLRGAGPRPPRRRLARRARLPARMPSVDRGVRPGGFADRPCRRRPGLPGPLRRPLPPRRPAVRGPLRLPRPRAHGRGARRLHGLDPAVGRAPSGAGDPGSAGPTSPDRASRPTPGGPLPALGRARRGRRRRLVPATAGPADRPRVQAGADIRALEVEERQAQSRRRRRALAEAKYPVLA